MKMNNKLLFATTMLAVVSLPVMAEARERNGTYTTGKGRTGVYSSKTEGTVREGMKRTTGITTENGKSYYRAAEGQYDPNTGQFTKSVTNAKGKTRTTTGTYENGQATGTYTTGSGKTGTFTQDRSREDGTLTRSTTVTPDGSDKSYTRSSSYTRDGNTVTRQVTQPDGDVRTNSVTINPGVE